MGSEMPLRVLVVDNDEPVCAATTGMLEYLGYHADCETDSLSALKVFSENPYQFDLAIRFRHIRPDFPVLFYAGYVDASLSDRIEADRFGHVVFKPFRLNELAAMIKDRLSPGPEHARVEKDKGP